MIEFGIANQVDRVCPNRAYAKKLSGSNRGLPESFFNLTVASGADPGTAVPTCIGMPIACGSVTNASSYGDSYEDAFYACVWRFYDVYVFFRKAYCC